MRCRHGERRFPEIKPRIQSIIVRGARGVSLFWPSAIGRARAGTGQTATNAPLPVGRAGMNSWQNQSWSGQGSSPRRNVSERWGSPVVQ